MDNPMRDVIEMMKNNAQREGKQQTSPVLKAAMQKRRVHENLSMALSAMTMVDESLTKAEKYTEEDSDEQEVVRSLCIAAESLRRRIEITVDEMKGE